MAFGKIKKGQFTNEPRRRTRTRRRKKAPQASTAVARVGYSSGFNLFPKTFISKMRWSKTYVIAAGTSDIANIQHFRLNGMYDPEVSVAAALQPMYFDQLVSYYSHYMVKGAKITVTYTLKSGNNMIVGVGTARDTVVTNYASRDVFISQPESRYRILTTQNPTARVSHTFSKNKIFGKGSRDSLYGAALTDPTEQFYAHTYQNNSSPGGTQGVVDMVVQIDYISEWTERAITAPS